MKTMPVSIWNGISAATRPVDLVAILNRPMFLKIKIIYCIKDVTLHIDLVR